MPWKHEDWEGFEIPRHVATGRALDAESMAREVLRRLPGRERKTLCDIDGALAASDPGLAHSFGAVVETSSPTCAKGRQAFDVVVALGTLRPASAAELDVWVAQTWDALVEGGVALFTVPAASALGGAPAFRLGRRAGESGGRFHEVELQYRLQARGFQGIRLRRVPSCTGGTASIVAMATRRVQN